MDSATENNRLRPIFIGLVRVKTGGKSTRLFCSDAGKG
jgi:hypothetical protein